MTDQAMTTPGLQAKVRLRQAWFEAHPNQPMIEGRSEVDRLLADVEFEAIRDVAARSDLAEPFMERLSAWNPRSRQHTEIKRTGVSIWRCIPIREIAGARQMLLEQAASAATVRQRGHALVVDALLGELGESPLPGARYAYDIVARRFSRPLAEDRP